MEQIADLLRWVWQRSQPASNTPVAVMTENLDRSSMADFVRILQAYDQDWAGRSWNVRPFRFMVVLDYTSFRYEQFDYFGRQQQYD